MSKVAILGAGMAGLSSGWLLKQAGIDFVVLERQPEVGGLARSFMWNGFHCDFAAHRLFTMDEAVLQRLLKLVPMGRHIRRSQIYLRGKWMRDPLDVLELGKHIPISEHLRVIWTYLTRNRNLPETSFENYVLMRYGQGLYDFFFRPYTEKLFGIPGEEISVLWARQKVRLSSPFDRFRENTKTKFQYFYYPVQEGYGAIVNRMHEEIQDKVLLNTTVVGLEKDGDALTTVVYEKDGQQEKVAVDHVISTLPMTLTGKMLGMALPLAYQKVDAVYLHINRPYLSENHWVYFMDGDVAINRMVEFKNMSEVDTPPETTVVCAEVTQEHENVVERVIEDLVRAGMLTKDEVLDTTVVREPFSYPVYGSTYDHILEDAQQEFKRYANLSIVGRAAEFRHREVDDNLASAIQAVGEIVERLAPEVVQAEVEGEETMPATTEPLVYAVILTYNHYEDTHECLESVFASDYDNLRVVLVDNGSSDGTPEKVWQNFPETHVIENEQNLGVPAGYNVGFSYALQAGAQYILLLNNDTVVPPEMLPSLVSFARKDPQAGILMPKVLYYGSEDRVWSSGGHYRTFPPAILMTDKKAQDSFRMIEYAPSCGLLVHRQAFEQAGLFDPGYFFLYDDWDFSERVRAHGFHIQYVPQARMWHKVSTTTQGPRSPLFWRTFGASIVRFYRRHGRPVWLSLPLHVGYVVLREFVWKRNWKYWADFREGMQEGLRKPLGSLPQVMKVGK